MSQPTDAGSKRSWQLAAGHELRFEVSHGSIQIKMTAGQGECFGTELAQGRAYHLSNLSSCVFTWQGCTLEIEGECRAYVGEETPMNHYANVHLLLQKMRNKAKRENTEGPRVMVVGSPDSGKSSLCKILCNYASRMEEQPLFVDLDIDQGSITMPGVVAAIPIERPIDIEEGFGTAPPIAYFIGDVTLEKNTKLYPMQLEQLAKACNERYQSNQAEYASGMIINTLGWVSDEGYSMLLDTIQIFSPTVILVLAHDRLFSDLSQHAHNRPIQVVKLPKSGGVVIRDQQAKRKVREAMIREYFYGPNSGLSPHSLQIPFHTVKIFKTSSVTQVPTHLLPLGHESTIEPMRAVETVPSKEMRHSILALSHSSTVGALLETNICGFVYISEINFERKIITGLSPAPRLPVQFLLLTEISYMER